MARPWRSDAPSPLRISRTLAAARYHSRMWERVSNLPRSTTAQFENLVCVYPCRRRSAPWARDMIIEDRLKPLWPKGRDCATAGRRRFCTIHRRICQWWLLIIFSCCDTIFAVPAESITTVRVSLAVPTVRRLVAGLATSNVTGKVT